MGSSDLWSSMSAFYYKFGKMIPIKDTVNFLEGCLKKGIILNTYEPLTANIEKSMAMPERVSFEDKTLLMSISISLSKKKLLLINENFQRQYLKEFENYTIPESKKTLELEQSLLRRLSFIA